MKKLKPNQFKQAQARKQQRAQARLGAVVAAAEQEAPVEFMHQYIYFVGYQRLDPRGNQLGNMVVRVPGPLDSTNRLRTMEQLVGETVKAQDPPSMVVGTALPNIVITCVSDLGAQDVPITPAMRERIKAMEAARAEAEAAEQAQGDAGEDGPHAAEDLEAPPATEH